ncbi:MULTISPECIES: hypothetical protein [Bacillus cereus group]|uniref:Uncharacterized protein n=1 Tax=Bacillus thuringiensis TaxID=1428 RepID=A0A9X6VE06_BACTU|nr:MULTISPECIES: hypothetical protein [Bacillus cereus group]MEC3273819.1 hypothetical protein [Bacillus thuringiensis]PFB09081.1 hypothetical protein CN398_05445 [Bacillus thuringiensis]
MLYGIDEEKVLVIDSEAKTLNVMDFTYKGFLFYTYDKWETKGVRVSSSLLCLKAIHEKTGIVLCGPENSSVIKSRNIMCSFIDMYSN